MNDGSDQTADASVYSQDGRSQPCVEGNITDYMKESSWPGAMSRQAGDGGEHQTARHDDIYLEHAVQESIKELGPIPRARRHYPDLPVELKVCQSCCTTATPTWRWAGSAKDVLLCNACSLRHTRSRKRLAKEACMHDEELTEKAPGKRDWTCVSAEQERSTDQGSRRKLITSNDGSHSTRKMDLACRITDFADRELLAGILLKEKLRLLGQSVAGNNIQTNEWNSPSWKWHASGNSLHTLPPSLQSEATHPADTHIAIYHAPPSSRYSSLCNSYPEIHNPLSALDSIAHLNPCLGFPSGQFTARHLH